MTNSIRLWLQKHCYTSEYATLWLFLFFIVGVFVCLGGLLAPVFVAIVLAYLLHWPILLMQRLRVPRMVAVLFIYCTFMGLIFSICGLVIPSLLRQLRHLLKELPHMAAQGQALLLYLPKRYPHYISPEQIQAVITEAKIVLTQSGQWLLSVSLSSLSNLLALAIYLVLVPLLVYFFLMDQQKILDWIVAYLPEHRRLIHEVWREVYTKTGHYVRGKALEIVIIWIITSGAFAWMGLPYAMLLGFLVGISSIIPYIGTIVVTLPVVVIALLEWGWSREFTYLIAIYSSIVILDANVLVPLLLSEAVSMHPVAIMIALLVFGGLLGFWGVFFAIPLAALSKALLNILKRGFI